MGRWALACVIALALAGTALASGSFSAKFSVTTLNLEANLEQEVTSVAGWTVYAGSGFALSPQGIEKLQPYTMICQGWDLAIAYTEICGEVRAPLIGEADVARIFTTIAW